MQFAEHAGDDLVSSREGLIEDCGGLGVLDQLSLEGGTDGAQPIFRPSRCGILIAPADPAAAFRHVDVSIHDKKNL